MSGKRAVGKKLIGAQASAELWAGVDLWLSRNPRKTVTDFVLAACLEKLKQEKILIDEDAALQDQRRRKIVYPKIQSSGYALIESSNRPSPPAAGASAADKLTGVFRKLKPGTYRRPKPEK